MKRSCRFLALLTALVLLCCSCEHELAAFLPPHGTTASYDSFSTTQTTAPPKEEDTLTPLPLINLKDNRYFYEGLSVTEQLYYNQILDELYTYSGQQTVLEDGRPGIRIYLHDSADVDYDTLIKVVDAVYDDHPELFYLRFDYLSYTNGWYAFVEIPYTMDLEERQRAADSLRGYVIKTAAYVKTRDDYRKALYVHDMLLVECEYNHDAAADLDDQLLYAQNSSAYSALCRDQAICGGYTRAMQLLLTFFDIPNTVVYNSNHIWNLVWFDGEPYHIDATWDDIDGIFCHTYFGVTTADLLKKRDIPSQTRPLPEVTATAANYHRRNNDAYYFDSIYDEAFVKSMGSQIEQNLIRFSNYSEYYAEARFSPDGYTQALECIQSGEFHTVMEYYLTDDNKENDFITKRMQHFQYYTYDDLCVIVFHTNNDMHSKTEQ